VDAPFSRHTCPQRPGPNAPPQSVEFAAILVILYPSLFLGGDASLPVEPDLYRILQGDPSADPAVIDAAYKRLARKYHPDLNRGDPAAEDRMKRINEAFRVLGKPHLRAEYDARTGAGLPELEIVPADIVLRTIDAAAREITFSVRLTHASGPEFDPSKHRIDLVLLPPWHEADVHWHWSDDRLPADVDFTLAFADGFLKAGKTLSGDIELTVTARDQP
jgi:curved DNA-binding protein CbpA